MIVEPVKDTFLTLGSETKASPRTEPEPVITCRTPSGNPASFKYFAIAKAVSGVVLAGFRTTAFPTASAGPILWRTNKPG